jgi:aldehyde dehydrogenase family 7 protein A1
MIHFRGRESGGDAWKQYVRWSACTSKSDDGTRNNGADQKILVNFSDAAPLAQGVDFSV